MDFDFVFASHYSRNLSIRVKEGIQTKLKKGEFPNRTPIGYFNKEGKIYPDPIYSLPVKRAFELYATGEYSLKQIVNKINDEGYRSRGRQTIRKSTFERILKNPIYIGIVRVNGINYKGIHEPIISQELFDTVQNISKLVSRPRFRKHVYLYRGYATCGDCGCLITASTKTKRNPKEYVYYYCTNGKFICDQHKKYIRGDKMQTLVQTIFDDLSGCMDSEIAELSLEGYYQSIKDKVEFEEQTKTNLDFQIKKNKEKQDKLLDLLLEEKIVQEMYDTKLAILKTEEKELVKQQTNFKPQDPDVTLELLNNFKTEAISLKKVFSEGDDEVKKDLLNSALWNFSVKDGKVANVRYKTLYEKLSKTAKSADLNSWLRD